MFRFTKRRGIAALALLATLAMAGGAYAYFSASGSGTGGAATVGATTPFAVTFGASTGLMYPGFGSASVAYTITNPGTGVEKLGSTLVGIANDGSGNIVTGPDSTPVVGCEAAWFTATDNPPTYGEIQPAGSLTGSVTVTMADVASSQDVCQGVAPDITVSAS
ncbi:MAG: hypothetical protein ABSH51_13490 [Solirubrobacteraceae bacterium]|jgi:hypothetical protein